MSAVLKTISRQDPDFESYLLGTFSKTSRALPVESLNVSSPQEQVTFEIRAVNEIEPVSFFVKWAEIFKIRSFIQMGVPLFLILVKNTFLDELQFETDLVLCTLVSLFSTLVAVNLLNDFYDHMKGIDRIHPGLAKRPLQKGWVTAQETRSWAWIWAASGVFFATPIFFVEPLTLLFVIPLALVALWAWIWGPKGVRYRRRIEAILFFLSGPLLALGFQLAVIGEIDLEALWIGVIAGVFNLFLRYLNHFEFILVNSQAGFRNTIARLGFEKSRFFLASWWVLFLANWFLYHWIYWASYPLVSWLGLVILLILSRPFIKALHRVQSPAGSEIKKLARLGHQLAFLAYALWLILGLSLILGDMIGA